MSKMLKPNMLNCHNKRSFPRSISAIFRFFVATNPLRKRCWLEVTLERNPIALKWDVLAWSA